MKPAMRFLYLMLLITTASLVVAMPTKSFASPTKYRLTILPVSVGSKTAINNNGQVVGSNANNQAWLYSNGTVEYLGTLGGNVSIATSINSLSQIVGYSTISQGTSPARAFLYDNGVMHDLGFGNGSSALAINNSGEITGFITPPGEPVNV